MAALGEARFVGGAVRNALLSVPVVDIDIAVPMPPQEALARLKAKKTDPWQGFFSTRQSITAKAKKALGLG